MFSQQNRKIASNVHSKSCVNLIERTFDQRTKLGSPPHSKIDEYSQQWSLQKKQKKVLRLYTLVQSQLNPQHRLKINKFQYTLRNNRSQEDLFKGNIVNRYSKRQDNSPNQICKLRSKGMILPDSPINNYYLNRDNTRIDEKQLKGTTSTSSNEKNYVFSRIPSFIKFRKQPIQESNKEQKNTFLLRHFILLNKIGETKHCKVFLVMQNIVQSRQKISNFMLVMKVFDKNQILAENSIEKFIRQVKIQSYLNHPNIIKLYGLFQDQNKLHLLMQYGCDGNLYQLHHGKKFTEETVSFITNQLLSSCLYMHHENIIHRDLKPENVVFSHGTAKICDFGWAAFTGNQLRNTYCGTPLYFSPQLMKGQFYDEKIDVWAVGVMAYQLLTGESPFKIKCKQDLLKIMTEPINITSDMSLQFVEFLLFSLNKNPQERLNCQQLLKLSFFSSYQKLETCEQLFK